MTDQEWNKAVADLVASDRGGVVEDDEHGWFCLGPKLKGHDIVFEPAVQKEAGNGRD